MISEIKTESDLFTVFFKKYLTLHGHREIMRIEHARLPDVQAVRLVDERIVQYEMKIGSVDCWPRLANYPTWRGTFKVKYRPGQLAYADKINTFARGSVRLVIYDRKKDECLICQPVANGEKSIVYDHIKNVVKNKGTRREKK